MHQSDDPNSSYGSVVQLILIGLAAISSLISLLIPALYHIKKQCRQHPTNLISKISLLQALSNYNVILIAVNIYKFEEYIDITNIFDIITFNQPEEPTETQFCQINYILYMFLQLSSIAYNIAFSVDLFITLKFPFYAGKKRMKFYNIFAVFFLFSTMPEAITQAYDICENQLHNRAVYKVPIIFIIVLGIFYAISFFIIIYSFFQTKKIGKVRAQYIRHHRIILLVLLSAWLFPLWTNILIFMGDQTSDFFYIVNLVSFVTLLLLGAFVNIIRFYNDRFLWEKVKNMIFCKNMEKKTNKEQQNKHTVQSDIWNVPLATAVAQLNNQKVVHSLIQVVAYACTQCQFEKQINLNIQETGRSKSIATFTTREKKIYDKIHRDSSIVRNKADLQQKFIERNIQNAKLSQLQQICKRTKKFNMFCLQDKASTPQLQAHKLLRQKTVFTKQKVQRTYTAQDIESQVPSRAGTDVKNHLSLIGQKDIDKIRNQYLRSANTKSINYTKMETYQPSQSDMHRNRTDNIQIKVVSHAHKIFSSIRKMNQLGDQQIQQSLDLQNNVENILKAKQSLGASGSFFFFSYDHKLIIKTIAQGEDNVLLKILPQYYLHLKKNKDTLLTKIYGLFSVQIAGISKITFILLQNSFQKMQKQGMQFRKYDLKGSTVKRQVKNPKADVFKDINYLKSNDAFIIMDPEQRQRLIKQIQADTKLLMNQNIMDYSLLLGVGTKSRCKADKTEKTYNLENQDELVRKDLIEKQLQSEINFQKVILKRRKYTEEDIDQKLSTKAKRNQTTKKSGKSWKYIDQYEDISGRIYSISIIDYLQQFNFSKYMELQLKKIFRGGGDISSVDSQFYFQRFLGFVKKIIVPVTNVKKEKNVRKDQSVSRCKDTITGQVQKETRKTIFQVKINEKWQDIYSKQE